MINIDEQLFEQVVIYNAMTDEQYLASILDSMKPEYFKDSNIRQTYNIIKEFYVEHGSLPTATEIKTRCGNDDLKQAIRTVVGYIKNVDKTSNTDELYNNTEQFIKERAVYKTLMDVIDQGQEGKLDHSELLSKFEVACNVNLNVDAGVDYFNDIDEHVDHMTKTESHLKSGWDWLDKKLNGGFLETGRSLYVFAGETNVGKSIFLGNIATNICKQGKKVLLISLEMPEMLYSKRLSSNIAQVPINEMHMSTEFIKESIKSFKNKHEDSQLLIKEFPPSTLTPQQLSGFITKVSQSLMKPDAIVLDYINLLKGPQGSNSYDQIKKVTEQVRALSYKFSCPIITATQLNRSGYNEIDPGLDTVGESYGMGATADCVISIFQREEDSELNIINLGMMKNRFGPNFGTTSMRIDYGTLTITEEELANDSEELSESFNTLNALSDD
jgi:replicative DNA helicase